MKVSWKKLAKEILPHVGIGLVVGPALYLAASEIMHRLAETPKHDGQMRMTAFHHYEVVASEKEIKVYVTDHDGFEAGVNNLVLSGKIILSQQQKEQNIEFSHKAGNVFVARGVFGRDENLALVLIADYECDMTQALVFEPYNPKAPPIIGGAICGLPKYNKPKYCPQ